MNQTNPPLLPGLQRAAYWAAGLGLVLSLAGLAFDSHRFAQAYLLAFAYWIGLALGCLALLMLHHLVGGRWGFLIRRQLEAGSRTLLLFPLIFVPVLIFREDLYHHWLHPEPGDAILLHKQPYLNLTFFVIRAALYFLIWIFLSSRLSRWSALQDQGGDARLVRKMNFLSAPGLVILALTVTLASVDWLMSLDPHWFSTIYGLIYIVGETLLALTVIVIVSQRLAAHHKPFAELALPDRFHELGNFMLAFVMLWAYMGVSQLLIIWSANLPEENPWYVIRMGGGWGAVGLALLAFHFTVPFLLLLWRATKRHPRLLTRVAGALIAMRFVDLYWVIQPNFHEELPDWGGLWMDVGAWLAIGGMWGILFLRELSKYPLIPWNDPRLPEEMKGSTKGTKFTKALPMLPKEA